MDCLLLGNNHINSSITKLDFHIMVVETSNYCILVATDD